MKKKPQRRFININLLRRQDNHNAEILIIGVLAMALLVMGGTMTGIYYMEKKALAAQKQINAELMVQANENKLAQDSLATQKKLAQVLNQKKSNVEKLEKAKQSYIDLLTEINLAVPSSIILTGIEITNAEINLSGFSPDQNQVAVLLSGLRKSQYFENAGSIDSSWDEETGEGKFTVKMRWEEEKQ